MSETPRRVQGVAIAEEHSDKTLLSGFLVDIFKGRPHFERFFPWPERNSEDLKLEKELASEFKEFLINKVDSYEITKTCEIPMPVLEELSRMGFFALRIPKEEGGRGLSQAAYINLLGLSASSSSAITILVSADNTIGCKFPVFKYGTPEQKAKLLPELTKWPSGFCYTAQEVGSDPAAMTDYAVRVRGNGKIVGYKITAWKWYTTNAPFAKYLSVVAKIVDRPEEAKTSECFGLFIVPADSPGITIGPRNYFSGMEGIYNANPKFDGVYVTKDHLIGKKRPDWEQSKGWGEREGSGFRIASEALNTGRIAIAGGCVATAEQALLITRWWAKVRHQWGGPLADKELVREKLAFAAADILAMDAVTQYAAYLCDQGKDVRLEAAACKILASEKMWRIVDDVMLQIRGGRGYERTESLKLREEIAPPVDAIWRGARPNRIFEGSNEILSQYIPRYGAEDYYKRGKALKGAGFLKKMAIRSYFAKEMCTSFWPTAFVKGLPENLSPHLRFVESNMRKFRREFIYMSAKHQKELARAEEGKKQLLISRFCWIALYLDSMAKTCSYAVYLYGKGHGNGPIELADLYCRKTQREVKKLWRELHDNDDEFTNEIAERLLAGQYRFLESRIIPIVDPDPD